MEDYAGGVDDREEGRRRPGGEGGFRFSEDQLNGWQPNFRIKFEARPGVVQCLAEGIQNKGASEAFDQIRSGFVLKKAFDGGQVTKRCHRG